MNTSTLARHSHAPSWITVSILKSYEDNASNEVRQPLKEGMVPQCLQMSTTVDHYSGESGEVTGETVDSWKEQILEIIDGYSATFGTYVDKRGCFWRAFPDKLQVWDRKGSCARVARSASRVWRWHFCRRQRRNQTSCCYTSENPRCFNWMNMSNLPVGVTARQNPGWQET